MSSDNPQISVEKIKIGCPSCKSKLNIPSNHIGKVSCPSCLQVFPFNSESEQAKIVAKHAVKNPFFNRPTVLEGFDNSSNVSDYNVHFTCYGSYQRFIITRYSRIVSLCRFFLLVASNRIQFGLQQWNFCQSFPGRSADFCIYWPHYCHCCLHDVLEFGKQRHYKLSCLLVFNLCNNKLTCKRLHHLDA